MSDEEEIVTMSVQIDVDNLAVMAHNVNKAYCESIGDYSQVSWDEASEHIKEMARQGVRFHVDNPDSTPQSSHENWMKEKLEAGWVYGEQKDEKNKTHPCLVPYDELPQAQKSKDYIFKAIVDTAIAKLKEYSEAMQDDVFEIDDDDEDDLSMDEMDFDPTDFTPDNYTKKNLNSKEATLDVLASFNPSGKPDEYDIAFCDEVIERLQRRGFRLERVQ